MQVCVYEFQGLESCVFVVRRLQSCTIRPVLNPKVGGLGQRGNAVEVQQQQ